MPVQILVVDDDEVSREVLALFLQRAGYAVEAADPPSGKKRDDGPTDEGKYDVETKLRESGETMPEFVISNSDDEKCGQPSGD